MTKFSDTTLNSPLTHRKEKSVSPAKHFGLGLVVSLVLILITFSIVDLISTHWNISEAIFYSELYFLFGFFLGVPFTLIWSSVNTGFVFLVRAKIKTPRPLVSILGTIATAMLASIAAFFVSYLLGSYAGNATVYSIFLTFLVFTAINFVGSLLFNLKFFKNEDNQ